MIKKMTKRDQQFGMKIKALPDNWCDYNDLLILENRAHGLAEFWKFIICHQQRDAARSLYFANSNQHTLVGHRIKRNSGKIVFSSQVFMKAYYLRYCILLLQACGDKLAQLVRVALDIAQWQKATRTEPAAEENTKITILKNHLKFSEPEPKPLFNAINSYLENDSVKIIIFQLANDIKHKWVTAYQGEGFAPIKNPVIQERNASGMLIKEEILIGMSLGLNIDTHIKHALITNNLFVERAINVAALLEQQLHKTSINTDRTGRG